MQAEHLVEFVNHVEIKSGGEHTIGEVVTQRPGSS